MHWHSPATTLARFCDFGVNPSVLYCVCSKLCQGDTSNTILRGGVILFPGIWAVQEGRLLESSPSTSFLSQEVSRVKKHDLTKTHLHRASPGMVLYAAFAGVTMAAMLCQPVFAATVWEKANEIMKDVYNQILLSHRYFVPLLSGSLSCSRIGVSNRICAPRIIPSIPLAGMMIPAVTELKLTVHLSSLPT